MTSPEGTFRARVDAALRAPLDGSLGSRFVAPLVTWLVADASASAERDEALTATLAALERVGVLRGRQFVLLGGTTIPVDAKAQARALRATLGVPVLVHDPAREGFVAGTLEEGTPIELDDELREAEAIVVVAGGTPRTVATTLVPGVACARTREAFASASGVGEAAVWSFLRRAEMLAPIDLLVSWDGSGHVFAASGRHALERLEQAAMASPEHGGAEP